MKRNPHLVSAPAPAQFWEKVQKTETCWLWVGRIGLKGYGHFYPDHRRKFRAHRVSWELTNGPIPEGMCVCHHCDTPACVNPKHLFLGTHQDNMADMTAKGRQARGEAVAAHRLTENDVRNIRALWQAGGITKSAIARQYGLGRSTVREILAKKWWRHVA